MKEILTTMQPIEERADFRVSKEHCGMWVATLVTDRAKELFDDCVVSLNFKTLSDLLKFDEKMKAKGLIVA